IWNLVFMQFDRDSTGKLNPLPKPSIDTGMGLERVTAVLQGVISNYDTDLFVPLIERAKALVAAEAATKVLEGKAAQHGAASLRVIADHSRAATFLSSDGVLPSNEGRGYVLRKIIRRAITHGRLLGQTKPFLYQMVFAVRDLMQDAYPELNETVERVSKAVLVEEQRFEHTMEAGLVKFEDVIKESRLRALALAWSDLVKTLRASPATSEEADQLDRFDALVPNSVRLEVTRGNADPLRRELQKHFGPSRGDDYARRLVRESGALTTIPGPEAFKLYDTFGMPLDFMQDAARDQGLAFDQAGFDRAMSEQRERARASWKGAAKQTANPAYQQLPKSTFEGYLQKRSEGCEVLAIIKNGQGVQELKPGEEGEVILDHTPFYAESGGQVGDRGTLYSDELNAVVAEVKGCYYPVQGVRAHQVVVKSIPGSEKSPLLENREKWGTPVIRVGDKVDAVVDTSIRQSTMRNHTATHLLHAGLREVLGKHVKQAGSLVNPNHLRFDFSHFTAVEDEELQDIEDLINKEVLRNERVEVINDVPIDVAINEYGAMALFGEKYGDKVRVIKIGDFSTELCGGTHTGATGEIGLIKILKEGSVSSGVRRVEAVTGEGSLYHFRRDHELENFVSSFVSPTVAKPALPQKARKDGARSSDVDTPSPVQEISPAEALKLELEKKDAEIKRLARELDQARMKQASSSTANISDKIKDVHGVKVLAHRVDNLERSQMRTLVDQLRDKIGSGVVVLGSATDGNVALIVGVTKDLTSKVQAGKVIGPVAQKVGGKGGGRPDLAEAGGKDPGALDAALGEAYSVVEKLLG
ncbi:MAG TPA: alanine--tRNA ligase-related protein, partial [Terriglobales bacterium]|nr:alanine--tRNA ligase-related protein [Terriglobales bacterium]